MRRTKNEILRGVNLDNVKSSKIIANNTLMIHYKNGITTYRLHNTDIIKVNTCNGNITLNSGGWLTHTTKDRLNRFTPCNIQVYQKNYQWYIKTPQGYFDFFDGITFDISGNIIK